MTSLNILVYPHAMEIGGSQLNAIELAAAVRDLGHRVTVLGEEGPLLDRVRGLGLKHLPLPQRRRRPSPAVVAQLRTLIRARRLDIVHGYEWPPGLESYAAGAGGRAAAVCTVMSMAVAPFLPGWLPLVVGTRALQRHVADRRPGAVHLIEPPVDVVENAPGHPTEEFRVRYGLDGSPGQPRPLLLAVVCRLVPELKLEGVLTAVEVVGRLAREHPVRLVVVGDGPARDVVEERARQANARAGLRAVVLTGELHDPRPAYAAADVMLGMGGSALRALAFGRPLVVQGERGFWQLLTPQSCATFLEQGWYGIGDGTGGADRLTGFLRRLIGDPQLRASLGRYGRDLAVDRFSLHRAARTQEGIYRSALAARYGAPGSLVRAADGLRCAGGLAAYKLRRRYARLCGTVPRDDFNAAVLAQAAVPAGAQPACSLDSLDGTQCAQCGA
ncbi:glycosyl transferase family 1 [Micromonospora sonchi]|uniref:Glycosyl transferase family 1 n=1 Tax=Micromonospora sonchi TaxID=1763543 RepID=A0A917TY98_9ACTN|nr:glycosyltransferase family 4 protein [Micromonospora sonchi]GGM42404.1 glycosyl transferase family 1 [Micromonospora sonchi]